MYIAPSNSPYLKRCKLNSLSDLDKSIKKLPLEAEILIIGDLNSRTQVREDFTHVNGGREVDSQINIPTQIEEEFLPRANVDIEINQNGKSLLRICQKHELKILNGRKWGDPMGSYTCFQVGGHSTVDYAIASNKTFDWINSFKVGTLHADLSDHANISVNMSAFGFAEMKDDIQAFKVRGISFLWNPQSVEAYKSALNSTANKIALGLAMERYNNTTPDQKAVDKLVLTFTHLLVDTAEQVVPYKLRRGGKKGKKNKKKDKPWFNQECKDLRGIIQKLGRAVQNGKIQARADFFKFKKQYKKLVKNKCNLFKKELVEEMCNADINKSAEYWTKLKKLRQIEQDISGSFIPFREWVDHFENEFKKLNITGDADKAGDTPRPKVFNAMDNKITTSEVSTMIRKLKRNKAAYFDMISTDMLIEIPHSILGEIAKMFNLIFVSGKYPTEWGKAYISPIYKKGAKDVVGNYRPIAISSCLGKIFNAVLNCRLVTFMDANEISHDYQNGFKKEARTSDNVLILSTIIDKYKHLKSEVHTCYIDLKGAYNTVDREILLNMLIGLGAGSLFTNLIENMYGKLEYCVKIGGLRSHFFKTGRGVKQGDTISPMLFNLYIHKLVKSLLGCTDSPSLENEMIPCLLFADDIVLISLSEEDLKEKVRITKEFVEGLGMAISAVKSKVVVYNQKRNHVHQPMIIDDLCLEEMDSYTYLGLDITSKGRNCVKNTSLGSKGRRAMYALLRLARDVPVKLAIKLFKQLIQPIILFGAEIWVAYSQINRIGRLTTTEAFWACSANHIEGDKLLDVFLKKVVGVKKNASTNGVRGDTGVFPVYIDAVMAAMKYWERLKDCKNRLLAAALVEQERMMSRGVHSWGLGMKKIKEGVTKRENPTENVSPDTSRAFKTKLFQEFESHWFSALWKNQSSSEGKFTFYRSFKKDFVFEGYLNQPRSDARREFTKLRISSHQLMVEKGRYNGTPREDRCCPLCKKETEDEMHFFRCRSYAGERLKWNIRSARTTALMEEGSPRVMFFVQAAMRLRKNLMKEINDVH